MRTGYLCTLPPPEAAVFPATALWIMLELSWPAWVVQRSMDSARQVAHRCCEAVETHRQKVDDSGDDKESCSVLEVLGV